MPQPGSPRLEQVVIDRQSDSSSEASSSRRENGHPLLGAGASPKQSHGWRKRRSRTSKAGSEHDPDEGLTVQEHQGGAAMSQTPQEAAAAKTGLSHDDVQKLSKLRMFAHLRDRPQQGPRSAVPPARGASMLSDRRSMAGDLHTSQPELRRPSGTPSQQSSHRGVMDEMVDLGELEESERRERRPFWRRLRFYHVAIPLLVSAILLLVGILLASYQTVSNFNGNFEVWRWLVLVGALVPVHWVGEGMTKFMVWFIETVFFFQKKALYFIIGTKKHCSRMFKSALVIALFAGVFHGQSNNSSTLNTIYTNIINALLCIFLWFVADVLKVLIAKKMASHFHQETYFLRMQEALRKEYFLQVLTQPRQVNRASGHLRGPADQLQRDSVARNDGVVYSPKEGQAPQRQLQKPSSKSVRLFQSVVPRPVRQAVAPKMVKFRSNVQEFSSRVSFGRRPGRQQEQHAAGEGEPPDAQQPAGPGPRSQHGAASELSMGRAASSPYPSAQSPPVAAVRAAVADEDSPLGHTSSANHAGEALRHRRSRDHYRPDEPATRAATPHGSGPPQRQLSAGPPQQDRSGEASTDDEGRCTGTTSRRSSRPGDWGAPPPRAPQRVLSRQRTNASRDAPAGYAGSGRPDDDSTRISGWAKLRMAHQLQVAGRHALASRHEKQREERHMAELVSNAKNDEEVIAKLHKVEKHLRKNNLAVTFTDQLGQARHSEAVTGEKEAKKLAFYLFWNVKPYFTRNHILLEDLEAFLPRAQAEEAFNMLDANGDGQLRLHDIRDVVIKIYRERRNLATSLKDTKTVVGKLELVLGVCIHVIFIFFYLLIFDVDINKVWLTLSSVIVAFSFVFGTSLMMIFQSVVLLFVVHPFDVGDALMLPTNASVTGTPDYVVVEELSLQSTIMRRWDGARIWFPNSKLNTSVLLNLSRSDAKTEIFKVQVDIATTALVTAELRRSVADFVSDNADQFTVGGSTVIFLDSQDPLKMTLGVVYSFTHNGVDLGRTGDARHKMYGHISHVMHRLGVSYSLPPMSQPATAAMGMPEGVNHLTGVNNNRVGPGANARA